MARVEELEARARELALLLTDQQVESSEEVDFHSGTYLLAAIAAELGQQVSRRCQELAHSANRKWELAAAEAETLVAAAWRCMATIDALSNQPRR
jgi:hypothetical protein